MNPLLPLVNLNEHENIVLQTRRAGLEVEPSQNAGFKQAMDSQTRDNPSRANESNRSSEKNSPQSGKDRGRDIAENKSDNTANSGEKKTAKNETKESGTATDNTKIAKANPDRAKHEVNDTTTDQVAVDAKQAEQTVVLDDVQTVNELLLGVGNSGDEIVADGNKGANVEKSDVNSVLLTENSVDSAEYILLKENQSKLSADQIINTLAHPLSGSIVENAPAQLQPLGLQNRLYSNLVTTDDLIADQSVGLKKNVLNVDTQALIDKNVVALENSEKAVIKTDINTATGISITGKNFLFQGDIITLKNEMPINIGDTAATSSVNKNASIHPVIVNSIGGINNNASAALTSTEGRVQLPVNITFGQNGWGNMVAERSAMMASQNIKFAELQLDPPELGPLQVKVSVNQDQASVSFIAANTQVRDSLDQAQARLRELLDEQGLNLVNVDVSDDSSNQSDNSSEGDDSDSPTQLTNATEEDTSTTMQIEHNYGVDHYV